LKRKPDRVYIFPWGDPDEKKGGRGKKVSFRFFPDLKERGKGNVPFCASYRGKRPKREEKLYYASRSVEKGRKRNPRRKRGEEKTSLSSSSGKEKIRKGPSFNLRKRTKKGERQKRKFTICHGGVKPYFSLTLQKKPQKSNQARMKMG